MAYFCAHFTEFDLSKSDDNSTIFLTDSSELASTGTIPTIPGLKEEIHGKEPEVIMEWLDGEESEYHLFHSREWWLNHIGQSDSFEVLMSFDLESFETAWRDWFSSKHEFALHDEKYFNKGIGQYLSTVGLVIRKV